MKNNFKKSFIWNTIGSGLNSFNSLLFMIIVTRINGIKDAGVFTLCFATSCMLYVIAIYSGRTYQVTETDKEVTDNEYIINRFLSSSIMLIISILWSIFNDYNIYKTIILIMLCVFKITEAIADVLYGILQKNDRLDLVGKSLFIKSSLNIILFALINFFTKKLILACLSLSIINILVIIIYDLKYVRKYKEKIVKKDFNIVLKIFTFGFYTFLYTLIANYLVNIPRYAIDKTLTIEYQTIYGILIMPASIIMLANMFIIQPVITSLKQHYIDNNNKQFTKLALKIISYTAIIGIGCIILANFFGIIFFKIVYGLDLSKYKISLLIIIFGATLYTISSVFFFFLLIMRETKIQVLIYTIACCVAYISSSILVEKYRIDGGAYSYIIMMTVLLIIYIITFIFKVKKWKTHNEK